MTINVLNQEKRTREVESQLKKAQQKKANKAKQNMNASELEYYKGQVETLKRLAAEKEALMIQKSINEVRIGED